MKLGLSSKNSSDVVTKVFKEQDPIQFQFVKVLYTNTDPFCYTEMAETCCKTQPVNSHYGYKIIKLKENKQNITHSSPLRISAKYTNTFWSLKLSSA